MPSRCSSRSPSAAAASSQGLWLGRLGPTASGPPTGSTGSTAAASPGSHSATLPSPWTNTGLSSSASDAPPPGSCAPSPSLLPLCLRPRSRLLGCAPRLARSAASTRSSLAWPQALSTAVSPSRNSVAARLRHRRAASRRHEGGRGSAASPSADWVPRRLKACGRAAACLDVVHSRLCL
jgi:hypothetical protein